MARIAPILLVLNLNCLLQAESLASSATDGGPARDLRWPQRQVKVLVDHRSLDEGERQVLAALLDQLEHRTCLRLERLPAHQVNPFAPLSAQNFAQTSEINKDSPSYNNFIYIFKAQFGRYHSPPSIGLSSLGCLHQGRQSIILTNEAFKWPQQVLAYHLLRSLGVANLTRPDAPRLRSFQLPALARIGGQLDVAGIEDIEPYMAPAVASSQQVAKPGQNQEYLSEPDLAKVKELYNCSDFQSRLSLLKPTTGHHQSLPAVVTSSLTLLPPDTQPMDPTEMEPTFPESQCKPLESCPLLEPTSGGSERAPRLEKDEQVRPMILKLDSFHAQDPQLQQANQMKLSLVPGENPQEASESFRLLEAPLTGADQQQLPAAPKPMAKGQQEMLISFEQTGTNASTNPIAAMASSQLLKLCSCTCQTMSPSSASTISSTSTSTATIETPTTTPMTSTSSTTTTTEPTSQTRSSEGEETSDWPVTQLPPFTSLTTSTRLPSTPPTINETTTIETTLAPTTFTQPTTGSPTIIIPTTTTTETTTEHEINTSSIITTSTTTTPKSTRSERPSSETATTAPMVTSSTQPPQPDGYCNQVEWVKPNKTVYGSARIVWDVDRANQNYFLCQNIVNGELVPGKTHGLACKVSSEGKAYELHNFQVLTKPEQVSLAWVQRNNSNFGKQNLPVVGGYSKLDGDPYLVSRCLVRDENNDVITMIGYVNGHGQGWFPFDDIQIECSQYDVLACV